MRINDIPGKWPMKNIKAPKPFCIGALLLFVFAALALTLLSTQSAHGPAPTSSTASSAFETHFTPVDDGVVVTIGELVVRADAADSAAERKKGLSGRSTLAPGTGMWFVYEQDGYYTYWMPNMHFALDIIWFDEHLTIVHIQENATPEAYPETYRPAQPARYVLEVPSGTVREYGISLGAQATTSSY